jgi:hypothetical protein
VNIGKAVDQGAVNLFSKGQIADILGFVGHTVSFETTLLLY